MESKFIALCALIPSVAIAAEAPLPRPATEFIRNYCFDCHESGIEEGDVDLELASVDWSDPKSQRLWAKVHKMLKSGEMPPKDETAPGDDERALIVQWIDDTLTEHSAPGGTVLQRLNRREYENSISALTGVDFSVPRSFPDDSNLSHFDTVGESLVLSPPLMQQYFEAAGRVADLLIPAAEDKRAVPSKTIRVPADGLSYSEDSGGFADNGNYRLFSSRDSINASATWPVRFEAKDSGVFTIQLDAAAYQDAQSSYPLRADPYKLAFYARDTESELFGRIDLMRKLAEFEVKPGEQAPQRFEATVELFAGETVAFRWEDSPMRSAPGQGGFSRDSLVHWLSDKRLRAAYNTVGYQRELSAKAHHALVFETAAKEDLDLDDPKLQLIDENFDTGAKSAQLWKFAKHDMTLHGPAMEIVRAEIRGPLRLIEDAETKAQKERVARFLGDRGGRGDRDYAADILRRFLSDAFRRPCNEDTLEEYVGIALAHRDSGHRFEDGLHLAIRAALCSPHFLYRGQRDGKLDAYDLASRLSFFLTSAPPDRELLDLAESGGLTDSGVLERQTRRLLASENVSRFLESFAGQWLDLDKLPGIMPDQRLLNWNDEHLAAVTAETRMYIAEILRENLPLETFIDSDFTYMNRWNAALYGIQNFKTKEMVRFALPPDKRRGGILTHPSVLMATANGVDTQPVLRGVWILENIIGDPTPEPPADIPAIEPDTSGAKTIRELLDRHKADASCASCHVKIDPPGFALENFDPVGRWRSHYPVYTKKGNKTVAESGQPVDSLGEMADGAPINDVTDLKRYLVENIDQFSHCLAEKLLVYSTGRLPGFGDQKQIKRIVDEVRADGNGFQDLIVALVLSDSFRVK